MVSRMAVSDGSSSPLRPSHPELFVQSKTPLLLKQPCPAHDAGLLCPQALVFGPRCRFGRGGLAHGCRARGRGRPGRRGLGCGGTVPISGFDCSSRRACDKAGVECAVEACRAVFGLPRGQLVAAIRWQRRELDCGERASMREGYRGRREGSGSRWRHGVIELRGSFEGGTSRRWRTWRRPSRCRPSRAWGVGQAAGFLARRRSGAHGSCSMSCSGRGTGERARAADEASNGGARGRGMP